MPITRELLERSRHRLRLLVSTGRMGRFVVVGGVGTAVDNATLVLLVEVASVGLVPAAVVAKELTILVMFVLNEYWTFASYGESGVRQLARRLVLSNLVRLGGIGVAIAVLYALSSLFGIWYVLANLVGIAVGFVFNYTFESFFTWNVGG